LIDSKRDSKIIAGFQRQFPGINRSSLVVANVSAIFYFLALFPSRNHWDTARILELARDDKSSDQWTAIYFRFLQALSFGGEFGMLPAIFGLFCLVLAFLFFVTSFHFRGRTINVVAKAFLLSPFIGVFGMTLTHEVQSTTGTLILSGLLIRIARTNNTNLANYKYHIVLSLILLSMIHTGIFIFLGFAVAYVLLAKRDLVFIIIAFCGLLLITLFGHQILGVSEQSKALRYQSFLGDIKCVVQHPDANISPADWNLLLLSGTREEWTSPSTCAYSQVYFAFPWVEKNQISTMKLWLKLASQNPQLAIEARIQRAANALPPLLFTAPQAAIEINYLKPVGLNAQDDLLIWSPLFKTSNDDEYQRLKFQNFKFMESLEAVAILPAHLLHRNSSLWGWAGLWLSVAVLLMYLCGPFRLRILGLIFLPQIFTCISLVLFSPISDPRYSMNVTLTSLVICALLIPELLKSIIRVKQPDAD
jgi:hypothetical protein